MTESRFENFLWICVGSLLLYIGDGQHSFYEILTSDDRVKRHWLAVSTSLVIVNAMIFLYLYYGVKCWADDRRIEEIAPRLTNIGGVLMIGSGVSFIIATWGVFSYFALFNMPMIFVSFLFLLDMFSAKKGTTLNGDSYQKYE